MEDKEFWKNKYSFLWKKSADREKCFKEFIEKETGLKLEYYGLAAGSDKLIHGSSKDNDLEKGAPDFHVLNTDIYIELTSSNSSKTKKGDPIWIRPDKLNFAKNNRFTHNEFIVNNFIHAKEWYVIHIDANLLGYAKEKSFDNEDFAIVEPIIRGQKEKYIQINSNNPFVTGLDSLIDYLKNVKHDLDNPDKKNSEIKKIRTNLNITQKEFAKYFGIPLATIQDWEHKRRTPPIYIPDMMLRIIRAEMSNK